MLVIEADAIVCAVRQHGEHGAIVRLLTAEHGLMAGYVRGGRSRAMRPVLLPANSVKATLKARTEDTLASLTVELLVSRAPLLSEPLPAAALEWVTALAATALPEGHRYPEAYSALEGVIAAIAAAPSARRWLPALIRYEQLVLNAAGYGAEVSGATPEDVYAALAVSGRLFGDHLLTGRQASVLSARERLIDRLKRAVA